MPSKKSLRGRVLLFVTALPPWTASAPRVLGAPVNDDFAGALALPAALPVERASTKADATTEPSELRPSFTEGTVWWTWTPATDGWVRITSTAVARTARQEPRPTGP